jgi:hypothetical protein
MAEIRPDSPGEANQFGRAIAKVAYCNAIAHYGYDGFEHMEEAYPVVPGCSTFSV